jgi:hypothetical protein
MATRFRSILGLLAAVAALVAAPAAAQPDSVTVVAGEWYEAGPVRRALWGQNYRHLWTRPVRVEVMDPDTFAGGLTPFRVGGDFASNTLHMRGRDGRRYVFRPLNKNVRKGLGPEFEGTIVEWIVQDQVSASNPVSPSVTAPLLQAAGILHARPRLVVMKGEPSLGRFREQFDGVVGMIEERPDENRPGGNGGGEDADEDEDAEAGDDEDEDDGAQTAGPPFAGADNVKGTDEFLKDLEDSPTERLDSREYLAARLLDIFIGDWDRHEDQWRWAGFRRGNLRVWRPIPRDRDNAFVDHEGLVLELARRVFPRQVQFEGEYPSLTGLTLQAEPLDRRLLSDLPRETWDSVAVALQARLTDGAIDRAVRAMPPEYHAREGASMRAKLIERRQALPGIARAFYKRLALNVDVHTTDAAEVAVLERMDDGSLQVTVTGAGKPEERIVSYRRRFVPEETDDVRLFLHGGDDRAIVRGTGHGIGIRVIGGGGDDVLADSSRSTGVVFYDEKGDNRFLRGPGTQVSTREWNQPVDSSSITGRRTYRDWGWSSSVFSTYVDWKRGAGPVIGGGPKMTKYGFRREPYAWKTWLRAGWSPLENRFLVAYTAEVHPENRRYWYTVDSYASELENVRFFGFGNDTERLGPSTLYDTWLRQVTVAPALNVPFAGRGELQIGPVAKWTDPEVEAGSPLDVESPLGVLRFGQVGARAEAELDRRDDGAFPRSGWRMRAGASAYPALWDAAGAFGEAHAAASAYVSFGVGPVLAVRAGGKRVWGEFPFHEAAFLGGGSTLRGHTGQRFAGDQMVFGGAELRQPLFRANLGLRGTFGVLGLADAGRVWYDGASEGNWHTAAGGGLFFAAAGQAVTLTVATGERTSVNLGFGLPF